MLFNRATNKLKEVIPLGALDGVLIRSEKPVSIALNDGSDNKPNHQAIARGANIARTGGKAQLLARLIDDSIAEDVGGFMEDTSAIFRLLAEKKDEFEIDFRHEDLNKSGGNSRIIVCVDVTTADEV